VVLRRQHNTSPAPTEVINLTSSFARNSGGSTACLEAGQLNHAGQTVAERLQRHAGKGARRKQRRNSFYLKKNKGERRKRPKKGGSFCHFRGRAPSLPPITLWPYLIHRLPRLPERVYISAVSLVTTTQMGIFSRDMTCRCGIPPASKQESIYRQRRRRGGRERRAGRQARNQKELSFNNGPAGRAAASSPDPAPCQP